MRLRALWRTAVTTGAFLLLGATTAPGRAWGPGSDLRFRDRVPSLYAARGRTPPTGP